MTTFETTIGIFTDYRVNSCITVADLYSKVNNYNKSVFTAADYCDKKLTTNLIRFDYDPYTGEPIDWAEVKRLLYN